MDIIQFLNRLPGTTRRAFFRQSIRSFQIDIHLMRTIRRRLFGEIKALAISAPTVYLIFGKSIKNGVCIVVNDKRSALSINDFGRALDIIKLLPQNQS